MPNRFVYVAVAAVFVTARPSIISLDTRVRGREARKQYKKNLY